MSETQVCKMFIGGLSLNTNEASLREYFEKWGEISDAVVMKEPGSKRSRGFGFVTYTSSDSVEKCLMDKPHIVDDKEVEAKRAVPREEKSPQAQQRTKKVFLGGLSPETTKQDIIEVLETYGGVVEVQIMTEKGSEKPRGFGFAILEDYESVDKLCIKKYHRIRDRDVEVKKAISQEDMRKSDMGGKSRQSEPGYPGGSYYPARESMYRGAPAYGGRSGGYDTYRMAGYEYAGRYPASDYMRSAGDYYGMGGFGERGQAAGAGYAAAAGYGAYRYPGHPSYDMNAYNMYGQGASMGSYSQTASSYGPNRGYAGGGADASRGDKDGRGGAAKFHPYRRT